MFWLSVILVAAATFLLAVGLITIFQVQLKHFSSKQEKRISAKLKDLFSNKSSQKIANLYIVLPVAFAAAGFLLTKTPLFIIIGALAGLGLPNFLLKAKEQKLRRLFNNQILDAIMILSSSLKGGLSLLQALEVLIEEMPAPMNQEMGLVVRENKMGVTLEESLRHLNDRMKMEELSLVINSILVARETGGDLTKVFSRLATTIRDNRKLKDSIQTLTMQGRMQGLIMSFLPFLFIWWTVSFNRQHFDIMLKNEIGRTLIFVAVILQAVGMFLIRKFSTINI